MKSSEAALDSVQQPPDRLEESVEVEAQYTLESPVKCPFCQQMVHNLDVVRLLRTKVNFTSSLPRRGYAAVCPSCRTLVSAVVG